MKYYTSIIALLVALSMPVLAFGGELVTLRQNITVEGPEITFGDVFDGAGDKSEQVIAPAPKPGKSVIFKAISVAKVARTHGLDWRPTSPVRRIKIQRLGTRIPFENISAEIRAALEYDMNLELFEISFASQQSNIKVGTDQEATVSVENIYVNKRSGQFTAELLAPANVESGTRFKISGKVHKQIMVPVLKNFTPSGREIREDDIEHKAVHAARLGRNAITDAALLIGKSPRRSVRAGVPVNMNNLGDPVTVKKGKLVAVVLRQGGLFLTVSGRTLEAGGTGDIIRVENINSRKVIQAQVVNEREVHVISASQQLAAVQ